jgi:hypothetical protein
VPHQGCATIPLRARNFPAVTEVYAELDRGKAIEIMSKVG